MNMETLPIRFIAGGITSMIVCYGTLIFLVEVTGAHYVLAANLATAFTYLYAYVINKHLVFRDPSKQHGRQGGRFLALQLVLIAIANAFLVVGVEVLHLHYFLTVALVAPILTFLNYQGQKIIVFDAGTSR